MRKFFKDFKAFISRGNIVDLAVGVIIGGAFSAIVTALTNKIIMPLINWALSAGGNGLESAYTFLKKVYTDGELDLTKSIYIDWGAFITSIIDFILIALVLFIILKAAMKSSELLRKNAEVIIKLKPNTEEKADLKARGVSKKDKKAYKAALEALRKEKADAKAKEEASKPKPETDSDVLKDIRELLKAQAEKK